MGVCVIASIEEAGWVAISTVSAAGLAGITSVIVAVIHTKGSRRARTQMEGLRGQLSTGNGTSIGISVENVAIAARQGSARMDQIDKRLDQNDERTARIEDYVGRIDTRLERTDAEVHEIGRFLRNGFSHPAKKEGDGS